MVVGCQKLFGIDRREDLGHAKFREVAAKGVRVGIFIKISRDDHSFTGFLSCCNLLGQIIQNGLFGENITFQFAKGMEMLLVSGEDTISFTWSIH